MEFNLIPQVIIIFSIGVIIFIFGRNIPKMKEMQNDNSLFENKSKEKRKFSYLCGKLTRRMKKDSYQEKTGLVWKWLEKSLRRIRIKFLKLDNKIVFILEKLKKKNIDHSNENFEFKEKIDNSKGAVDESRAFSAQPFVEEPHEEKKKVPEKIGSEKSVVDDVKLRKREKDEKSNMDRPVDELQTSGIINEEENEEKNKSEDKIRKKEERSSKEKEYIDLILRSPKNIKAYWKLGIIYSRRKKYKDSISCFRQIIKIDPGYTKAKRKIADLIKRMKKNKKADKEK